MSVTQEEWEGIQMLITTMHEYQRRHNVTKMCISNVTTVLDFIDGARERFRAKTVFAVWQEPLKVLTREDGSIYTDTPTYTCIHLVVQCADGRLLDPSFEVAQHNPTYVDSFAKLTAVLSELEKRSTGTRYNEGADGAHERELFMKDLLAQFLRFEQGSVRKLNSGGWCYTDNGKEFYHAQFDFLNEWIQTLPLGKKRKIQAAVRFAARA
jgi:hypothetical protein